MRILIAGLQLTKSNQLCVDYVRDNPDVPLLYSFLNDKRHIENFPYKNHIFVDSGAHSWNKNTIMSLGKTRVSSLPDPFVFMKSYLDFIERHKDKGWVFAELDIYKVVPKDAIDDWYKQASQIKGNFQFVRVYHPTIDGGTLTELKKWIAQGQSYIGIGNDSTPILNNIFRLTRDKVKIHGFAMTKRKLIEIYPFYSCDSTTWLSGSMYGRHTDDKTFKGIHERDMVKKRSFKVIHTRDMSTVYEQWLEGLKSFHAMQTYGTNLWTKRGIKW